MDWTPILKTDMLQVKSFITKVQQGAQLTLCSRNYVNCQHVAVSKQLDTVNTNSSSWQRVVDVK